MNTIRYLSEKTEISQKRIKDIIDNAPYLYRDKKILQRKNGKYRDISMPYLELKTLQQKILANILRKNIFFPSCLHGGIENKSIYTNALPHTGKRVVICLDIKNFFPSIHFKKLEKDLFYYFDKNLSSILIRLTTHNYCLPQGAPTSPFLSNLCFLKQDKDISKFCKSNNISYTRFFDDITISGKNLDRFIDRIESIIRQGGFKINKTKKKIQPHSKTQFVTGIIVNTRNHPRVSKTEIDKIRREIVSIKKLGLDYLGRKNIVCKEIEILKGRISFIKQIEPLKGEKLRNDFLSVLDRLRI